MYTYVATCMFGLEKQLGEEIDSLGLERILTMDGRVIFRGDAAAACRANINLRVAERVYLLLGNAFPAQTFDALFEGCRALPWEDFIGRDDAFPVSGHSIKSTLTSIPDCQKIIKKAMAVRLGDHYGIGRMPETGVMFKIEFFIFKDEAYLMIDTSGIALHKRGYRPVANAAPLRETLAAALVMNARIREDILLWDPFCGSGTIAIEGAMFASHRAPGLGRNFAGEEFPWLPRELWTEAREEAQAAILTDSAFRAYGSDIDPDCIDTASANARRAGVDKHINFFVGDARRIRKPDFDCKGTLICNPPYGERMMTVEDAESLYRAIGRNFASFEPWQVYVLTSCEYFEKLYGRRADKTRKLYNGTIPAYLYQFFKPRDNINYAKKMYGNFGKKIR